MSFFSGVLRLPLQAQDGRDCGTAAFSASSEATRLTHACSGGPDLRDLSVLDQFFIKLAGYPCSGGPLSTALLVNPHLSIIALALGVADEVVGARGWVVGAQRCRQPITG
jgi:hypothetical protein